MEASAFGIDKLSTCKTVAVKMLKGKTLGTHLIVILLALDKNAFMTKSSIHFGPTV